MLTVSNDQMDAFADAMPGQPVISRCSNTKTWISIELRDDDQNPVPRTRYKLRLPDYTERDGMLDETGRARVDDIMAGTCQVSFPDIDAREWFPA